MLRNINWGSARRTTEQNLSNLLGYTFHPANPLPGIHPTGTDTPRTNFRPQENYKPSPLQNSSVLEEGTKEYHNFLSLNLNSILHFHHEHIFMWDLAKKVVFEFMWTTVQKEHEMTHGSIKW